MSLQVRLWLGTLIMALVFNAAMVAGAESGRPNILLIVSDDQRPDTIHALGNAVIRTPHLDRLVARGTAFTRAYTGYPICYASRAEILTGCHSFRALKNYPASAIDPALATFAGTFAAAGYHTWYSGKWHNDGQPTSRGYTATRALYSSGGGKGAAAQPLADTRERPLTGYRGWTFKTPDGKPEPQKGVGLQPDNCRHIGEGAITAIKDTPPDRPFFAHVNFAFPHDPRMWPEGMEKSYDPATLRPPANFAPIHPFDHGNLDGRDEELLPKPRSESAIRDELALYYAMITAVDVEVGRILATLEQTGRLTHTIIVFTSDQGLALGSHGLLGKQNQYEHSIRAPLIMAGPGIPAGTTLDALAALRDIFPTCCDLAGLPIPPTVQARSLRPLLQGKAARIHDFLIGTFTDTQRMLCDTRWKYIWYPRAGREQLFDLMADPLELSDLAGDAGHAATRAQLRQRLLLWCRENGDKLPQP